MKYEENPFESEEIAKEWIGSVEGEEGMFRDKIIYPLLEKWSNEIESGIILEIGAGQGACAEHINGANYIGVEPSIPLAKRAEELYQDREEKSFVAGNAYDLPLASESVDAVFSVNVWFHLGDLKRGSAEMARVMKEGGKFLIVTANPESYKTWESFYESPDQEGNKMVGKVNTPVVPLSKNVFYRHSIDEIKDGLEGAGLKVEKIEQLSDSDDGLSEALFIEILGNKPLIAD